MTRCQKTVTKSRPCTAGMRHHAYPVLLAVVVCMMIGPADAANICEQAVIQQKINLEKTTIDGTTCDDFQTVATAYLDFLGALGEALQELEGLYRSVDAVYGGDAQASPAADAAATYAADMATFVQNLTGMRALNFQDTNVKTSLGQFDRAMRPCLDRLVGKISDQDVTSMEAEYKIAFCKAMLEWKRAQQWRKKLRDCLPNGLSHSGQP